MDTYNNAGTTWDNASVPISVTDAPADDKSTTAPARTGGVASSATLIWAVVPSTLALPDTSTRAFGGHVTTTRTVPMASASGNSANTAWRSSSVRGIATNVAGVPEAGGSVATVAKDGDAASPTRT